jgi:uncharacterized membrane protein
MKAYHLPNWIFLTALVLGYAYGEQTWCAIIYVCFSVLVFMSAAGGLVNPEIGDKIIAKYAEDGHHSPFIVDVLFYFLLLYVLISTGHRVLASLTFAMAGLDFFFRFQSYSREAQKKENGK